MAADPLTNPSVSVVIPVFTLERWALIERAVESARAQTVRPESIVVCVDMNDELFARARARWRDASEGGGVPVMVIANQTEPEPELRAVHRRAHGTLRRFGAGRARNVGAAEVTADIIAFIDDDAWGEPTWLESLLSHYTDSAVAAVGGASLPYYETARPAWFPDNFDWIFGCSYSGLPKTAGPLGHLIGANMSVRRSAFEAVGGFTGSDFDDLNLCLRIANRFGASSVVYDPQSVVHHFVTKHRVTWRYFYRRCYIVNREKVRVLAGVGSAANLKAEREFVALSVTKEASTLLGRGVMGNRAAFAQLGAMAAGVALAGTGYAHGLVRRYRQRG
jgi:glycosyltransferase involved in cell wall biosynthesis